MLHNGPSWDLGKVSFESPEYALPVNEYIGFILSLVLHKLLHLLLLAALPLVFLAVAHVIVGVMILALHFKDILIAEILQSLPEI